MPLFLFYPDGVFFCSFSTKVNARGCLTCAGDSLEESGRQDTYGGPGSGVQLPEAFEALRRSLPREFTIINHLPTPYPAEPPRKRPLCRTATISWVYGRALYDAIPCGFIRVTVKTTRLQIIRQSVNPVSDSILNFLDR